MNTQRIFKSMLALSLALFFVTSIRAQSNKSALLIVAPVEKLKAQIKTSIKATRPDYVVFRPQIEEGGVSDTGNEHFLVFDGPDGSLMAVWTQSSHESERGQPLTIRPRLAPTQTGLMTKGHSAQYANRT